MNYLVALLAAVVLGAGFVLQQRSAEQVPKGNFLSWRLLLVLLRDRMWLAGLGTMMVGQLMSAWVLGHLVLSLAEPLLAANLLFALLLAWPLSRQRLARSELIGAVVLIAGVAALSLGRSVSAPGVSVGAAANWPIAAGVLAAASYGFAAAGRRRSGDMRATLTAVSAGLVFGFQDALTRKTVQGLTGPHIGGLLTSWPAYALIVTGAVGLWLMQSAFSAGPLHASLPAVTAGEPLTGIALGIVIYGDRLATSPGLIALEAAGVVALVAGVILVARGPALAAVWAGPQPRAAPVRPPGRQPAGPRPRGDGEDAG